MLGLSGSLRVFLAVEPVGLRKSFNRERVQFPDACVDLNLYENNLIPRGLGPRSFIGLHAVVLDRLKEDPCSGALYVFTNRRLPPSRRQSGARRGQAA